MYVTQALFSSRVINFKFEWPRPYMRRKYEFLGPKRQFLNKTPDMSPSKTSSCYHHRPWAGDPNVEVRIPSGNGAITRAQWSNWGKTSLIVMSDFKPRFLKPSETSSFLDRNDSSLADSTDFVYNRHLSQSIQTQRQKLPIFNNRNHVLFLLEKFQTLVLVGETGCGKSTQIPQVSYFYKFNWV